MRYLMFILFLGCARPNNEIGQEYITYHNICIESKSDCYTIDSQGNTFCDSKCLKYHCYKSVHKKAKYPINDKQLSYEFLSEGLCF